MAIDDGATLISFVHPVKYTHDPAYMLCSKDPKITKHIDGKKAIGAACNGNLGGPALILDKNQRWQTYVVI